MLTVVGQEILQPLADQGLVIGVGTEGAADQSGCAIADVAGNQLVGEFGASQMPERGIDRVNQVKPRVNERAIEIENEQLDGARFELTVEADHGVFPA